MLGGSCVLAAAIYEVASLRRPPAGTALVRSSFEPYVGEQFSVRTSTRNAHALQLFKVRSLGSDHNTGSVPIDDENFSLLFRGPVGDPLDQGVFDVEHRSLQAAAILIVPMRPEADARYYEAIFNRSLPTSARD